MHQHPASARRPRAQRALAAALVAALASVPAATAGAQLVGPVYPPPGGTTFAGSGSSIGAGGSPGQLNTYRNFDDSRFVDLYWTPTQILNPRHSSQAPTGSMSFAGYDAATGIATWTSTANVVYASASGTQSLATRLRMQFQPYTGANVGPLAAGWYAPTTVGAAGIAGLPSSWPVLDVAALASPNHEYQVWYRYETAGGAALGPAYDASHSLGGALQTSLSGGFFYSTPEPGTVVLLASGLGVVAAAARRRRAAAAG